MLVMPLGIVIEVKAIQPANALFPMLVTLFGIVIEVKPVQSANALFPMLVTLFGIVIEVKVRSIRDLPAFITRIMSAMLILPLIP